MLLLNEGLGETLVQLWTERIRTWENNRAAQNPYYLPVTSESVHVAHYLF